MRSLFVTFVIIGIAMVPDSLAEDMTPDSAHSTPPAAVAENDRAASAPSPVNPFAEESNEFSSTSTGRAQDLTELIRQVESLQSRVESMQQTTRIAKRHNAALPVRLNALVPKAVSEVKVRLNLIKADLKELEHQLVPREAIQSVPAVLPDVMEPKVSRARSSVLSLTLVQDERRAPAMELNPYIRPSFAASLDSLQRVCDVVVDDIDNEIDSTTARLRDLEAQMDSSLCATSNSREIDRVRPMQAPSPPPLPYAMPNFSPESGSRFPRRVPLNVPTGLADLGLSRCSQALHSVVAQIEDASTLSTESIRKTVEKAVAEIDQDIASDVVTRVLTSRFETQFTAIKSRSQSLATELERELLNLQVELRIQKSRRQQIEREFRKIDAQVQQLGINEKLVYAVYFMIVTIVVLFLALWIFPAPLSQLIINNRVLVEVLSMGFLLLTVIILGTGQILQREGVAALLGTIAGYIFARKAAEFAAESTRAASMPTENHLRK